MSFSSNKQFDPEESFLIRLFNNPVIDRKAYFEIQRKVAREYKIPFFNKDKLIKKYHILVENDTLPKSEKVEQLLRLKNTRSSSGIVVVSVLTKPYQCPGNCLYCPTEENAPKSYIKDEPAVMRAIACDYDPHKQVISRLKALRATGHSTDKINIRLIGGTWSFYENIYQTWFIKMCFSACNGLAKKDGYRKSLDELQKINETAKDRIVEISIETRQDYINNKEIRRLRSLGVTKVELGVQSIYDDVLKKNNRGHSNIATIEATKLLKDAGFKVSFQMMTNLPGSNLNKDKQMFLELFSNSDYQPDYLKIYPLALVKEAPVFELYKRGEFKPHNTEQLKALLKDIKKDLPYYVRVERVIRDIPANYIVEGGAKVSNLRQIVCLEMEKEGNRCNCIRCREIMDRASEEDISIYRQDYNGSDGKEIFLTFENKARTKLHSMIRLRIPSQFINKTKHNISALDGAVIVREIHSYGQQTPIDDKSIEKSSQHRGLGKKLLTEAETIAKKEFEAKKIAVIAGVGARKYFRKLGYELKDTYMIKNL